MKKLKIITLFSFLLLLFFSFGCSRDQIESYPPPSSSLSNRQKYLSAQLVSLSLNKEVLVSSGNSMHPSFGEGAVHIVEAINDDMKINVGDIVVISIDERNYTLIHRVIEINSMGLILTKGDNNVESDGWRSIQSLRYKVLATFY